MGSWAAGQTPAAVCSAVGLNRAHEDGQDRAPAWYNAGRGDGLQTPTWALTGVASDCSHVGC